MEKMNPNDIRAELVRRGVGLADIGRMVGCSRQMVWLTIHGLDGKGKAALVKKKISEIIGRKI